jgi:hypothetical protein
MTKTLSGIENFTVPMVISYFSWSRDSTSAHAGAAQKTAIRRGSVAVSSGAPQGGRGFFNGALSLTGRRPLAPTWAFKPQRNASAIWFSALLRLPASFFTFSAA